MILIATDKLGLGGQAEAAPVKGPSGRDALDTPDTPRGPGGPGTAAGILERTETETKKSPGDGERFAHFVRKDKITSSAVTGQPVVALCGKVWVPMRNPAGFPICPVCKSILDSMGKKNQGWPFDTGAGD